MKAYVENLTQINSRAVEETAQHWWIDSPFSGEKPSTEYCSLTQANSQKSIA